MLKSKPRDDWFPDHIISQTRIHTPKSGVLFCQVLASGLPQSDHISNRIYELPVHIEVFNKNTILSQYPHWYSWEKKQTNLQNDTNGQVQKPVIKLPPLKEMILAIFGPKALESFQTFNQNLDFIMYC